MHDTDPILYGIENKVRNATKWSAMTEILAKTLSPVVNMVLARLLTPEAFGIVATLTMIITFAEIFTDAGFQKYLIQHEFQNGQEKYESTNVAFWSNLMLSLLIWGLIALFCEPIATLVGNSGLGHVLVIACASVPLAAFSSIQMALYRRSLDFKTLFKIRMVGLLVPLLVTVPLAFIMRNFWALVIGTLAQNAVNALMLTWFSQWRPKLSFSVKKLYEMASFTSWSLMEAVTIWLTSYVDIFIVGTMLSQHYLGLYKTSLTLVGQIFGLITTATTPILFSSLSRLQNDDEGFRRMFFKMQRIVGMLVLPLGVGIFCYSDFITYVLLGNQWMDAAGFIGLWGLTSSVTIIFSHYSSEVYRAIGRPKLSVLAQVLHIAFLWPTVLIAVRYGFEVLYVSRSLIRFQGIIVHMILMYRVIRISPFKVVSNVMPYIIASSTVLPVAYTMRSIHQGIWWTVLFIIVCMAIYGGIVSLFPSERNLFRTVVLKRK